MVPCIVLDLVFSLSRYHQLIIIGIDLYLTRFLSKNISIGTGFIVVMSYFSNDTTFCGLSTLLFFVNRIWLYDQL